MKIKHLAEDFVVEEVGADEVCSVVSCECVSGEKVPEKMEGRDFLWCEMVKREIDHFSALKIISDYLGISPRDIGYAGTKDKVAVTSQRISLYKPDVERLRKFSHENIVLKNFKWMKRKIKIGYLEGNRFRIVVRDLDKKEAIRISGKALKMSSFANFFGAQRFGKGEGNVRIGKLLLKRKFEEAVLEISKDNMRDRIFMEDYLARNAGDFLGAIKRLNKKNLLMYVNAVQSRIFNTVLEETLSLNHVRGSRFGVGGEGKKNLSLFGYKTRFSEGELGEIERGVLLKHDLELGDFDLKEIGFLRMKGSFRKAMIEVRDLKVRIEDDEIFSGARKIILEFVLPSGCYATTLLDNIVV